MNIVDLIIDAIIREMDSIRDSNGKVELSLIVSERCFRVMESILFPKAIVFVTIEVWKNKHMNFMDCKFSISDEIDWFSIVKKSDFAEGVTF